MAGRGVIAARQEQSLGKIRDVLIRHHAEAADRLSVYTPSGVLPNSFKMPDQYDLYLSESVQLIAELIDPILEDRKPKKRGRKPKARKDDEAA